LEEVRFSVTFQTGPGLYPGPCTTVTESLSERKSGRWWRGPPTPFSTEVKERVKLYLYSPLGFGGLCKANLISLCNMGNVK
jgi:hypothetical protein